MEASTLSNPALMSRKRVETHESRPLEGPDFVGKGYASVKSAEARKGPTLVGVEKAFGGSDARQPDSHNPFQNLRYSFQKEDDAEGGRGIVRGLSGLI